MPAAVDSPTASLAGIFIISKTLLAIIACLSPGIGYDTSTSLQYADLHAASRFGSQDRFQHHLIRWDALYFTSSARRGYLYEQEWAFGWGFTQSIRFFCKAFFGEPLRHDQVAWAAIATSHGCHFLSVLAVHRLYRLTTRTSAPEKHAFIAATLHIISPAGIFLSAPYGESTFSCLSIIGYCLYVYGLQRRGVLNDASTVAAGAFFGAATSVRSNGILNGALFAIDLLLLGPFGALQNPLQPASLILGGLLNAFGSIWPQYKAYQEFCTGSSGGQAGRSWCTALVPSVYTFVQRHYWNVGFLRYWTVSNIPLFLLALPMLTLMLISAALPLKKAYLEYTQAAMHGTQKQHDSEVNFQTRTWAKLAVPQLLLTGLALTNFHVQVITRLSSGYVLMYVMVAGMITGEGLGASMRAHIRPKWVVQWMVMYALIQGGLFASFLPPA